MKPVTTLLLFIVILSCNMAWGEFPYPSRPGDVRPQDFERYLFLPTTSPPTRPNDFGGGHEWKYTSDRTTAFEVVISPHELRGVKGMSVDLAWQVSTGRPDVLIAVLDSGIKWNSRSDMYDLVKKVYLNRGELPLPRDAQGRTKADLIAGGHRFLNPDDLYDLNDDGVFNMLDYASNPFDLNAPHDPRLRDLNNNGFYDPEDLILNPVFCNGIDHDNNGYACDIAGWNFLDNNNNPFDDVQYGHGTGEALDSTAEANNRLDGLGGALGACPNCMVMPVRVGDSFIADAQAFAQAVVFAVDTGAHVIQEALGTVNNTRFAQAAIDYAFRLGVPVIASAADEESFHHNFPAANNHTITVNSVTKFPESNGTPLFIPRSYLYLNGCTNFGGSIAVSVSSSSCSSEATGRGAGIAGLIVSAALNEVKRGNLEPFRTDPRTRRIYPLSADEVKQIMTMTADDINFPTALDRAVVSLIRTERFPSQPGWDQYFGYGRVNSNTALRRVAERRIPPEADVTQPMWWETLDPISRPQVEIVGSVAARRANGFTYAVEYGCGIQPRDSAFVTIFSSDVLTDPITDGPLATWDISGVAESCQFDASAPPNDPNTFAVTLRIQVIDDSQHLGEARRTVFIHHDPDLLPGFPMYLGGSGEPSPVIATLAPGETPTILVATGDGLVYAFRADGTLRTGWPVHTNRLDIHTGSSAFQNGEVSPDVFESIAQGGLAVGDLDGDGTQEVVATSLAGKVYVWEPDGTPRMGFPVGTNPIYSQPSIRDPFNRLQRGIASAPVLADLDNDGRLEIIAAAMDRHVYAWKDNGSSLPGWPVLAVDRTMMASIDPMTHKVVPRSEQGRPVALTGTKILSTPAVGDLDGDGFVEVVVGTNEEYREEPNFYLEDALLSLILQSGVAKPANGRLYAIQHDGNNNPVGPFVNGWPAKIGIVISGLLPWVKGVGTSPALADVDGDGRLEVGISPIAGPAYLLRADGTSFFGNGPNGKYRPFSINFSGSGQSNSPDRPSFSGLGSGAFADLEGLGGLVFTIPGQGLGRAIDNGLPAMQIPSKSHVNAWDVTTGQFLPAYPRVMEDLQFFTNPVVADINGDGLPEIVLGSGGYILHAFDIMGREPTGWPKFTGGWIVATGTVGDVHGDGSLAVVNLTREGNLYIWRTPGRADGNIQWPRFHHDNRNTGLYTPK